MKNLLKNWKTTVAGGLTLAAVGFGAYTNPAILANPQTLASIASAIGLIVAADSAGKNTPAAQ
jgi:hypothetical protein